jgi:hypothetical protein
LLPVSDFSRKFVALQLSTFATQSAISCLTHRSKSSLTFRHRTSAKSVTDLPTGA